MTAAPVDARTRGLSGFASKSCCRLTTLAWTGAEVETRARLGVGGGGRLYVRLGAASLAAKRIWNREHVRVVPCTPAGRATGPAIEGCARILSHGEDESARRALARDREPDGYVLYAEVLPARPKSVGRAS
jgi:PPOX class probable F420-dependent enzyme